MSKKAENPPIKKTGTSIWLIILPYVRPLDLAKLNCLKFTLAAVEHLNIVCINLSYVLHLRSQNNQGCRVIPALLAKTDRFKYFSTFKHLPWLGTGTWRVHLCQVCIQLSGEGDTSGSFPVEGQKKRQMRQEPINIAQLQNRCHAI